MVSHRHLLVSVAAVIFIFISCLPSNTESKISKIKMRKKLKMLQEMLPYIMMMKKKKILPVPVPIPLP